MKSDNGTATNGRQRGGRFAPGNPGGPGRPRRAVEAEYLAALNDAISLDDWRLVVERALADAKAGDAKARDWLCRYLLDGIDQPLFRLAADEHRGKSVEARIQRLAERGRDTDSLAGQ